MALTIGDLVRVKGGIDVFEIVDFDTDNRLKLTNPVNGDTYSVDATRVEAIPPHLLPYYTKPR